MQRLTSISPQGITDKIVGFCDLARHEGFNIGIQETCDALMSIANGMLMPRQAFRRTLRSLMCSNQEEFERFDSLFEDYWKRRSSYGQRAIQKRTIHPYTVDSVNHSLLMLGHGQNDETDAAGERVTGASATERLQKTDFSQLSPDESKALDQLAGELWKQMSRRMTRRLKNSERKEKIHLRSTIRKNISRGGYPIQLQFRGRKRSKPRLVVLLDVSGSMDLYSLFFLKFIYSLHKHFEQVESFIFSTKLQHVTKALAGKGLDKSIKALEMQADAWSSGTTIGTCFQTFNFRYAKRVLARNSILVVLSDGWDTGDPEVFRRELELIRRRTRKIIWLNPLLGMDNYEPVTRGLSTALPLIDVFIPAHNLESLLQLEKHLVHV